MPPTESVEEVSLPFEPIARRVKPGQGAVWVDGSGKNGQRATVIIDGMEIRHGDTIAVDLCIVGAGPAGISLASRFLRRPGVRVALIETGGLSFRDDAQVLAEAESEGQPYFPLVETRIRALGGTSWSYGGISTQLDPIDLTKRDWVPHSGWPITLDEIGEYYAAALAQHGVHANKRRPDLGVRSDDPHGIVSTGEDSTCWKDVIFTSPTRFGPKYKERLASSKNVNVYLHSTVTALDLDPAGARVERVRIASLSCTRYFVSASHYVLAGGGVENPRLLLVSNSVAANGVGNSSGAVGRFFQEHPRVFERFWLPPGPNDLARFIQPDSTPKHDLHFARLGLTEAVQREEQLLNYHANVKFGFLGQDSVQFAALRKVAAATRSPWRDSPYAQDAGGGRNKVRLKDIGVALTKPHRSAMGAIGALTRSPRLRRWVEIESSLEQVPRSDNRIELTSHRDKFGTPRVRLHWSLSDAEERTYRRGRELTLSTLDRYAPGLSHSPVTAGDPWPSSVVGTWHHAGTTRMDDDPTKGVVDADCKVHDVENLYIAGSSVFPTSGSTSPTLTIIALALRLGDYLHSQLQPSHRVGH